MRLLLISALIAFTASAQAADNVNDRMRRLSANTICIVTNTFYLRDMVMLAMGYGIATGGLDAALLEKQVLEPVTRSSAMLENDRQTVIKELIELGVSPKNIAESLQELVTSETMENIQSWMSIRDAKTAQAHIAKIVAKHKACDAHYKAVRGQPV